MKIKTNRIFSGSTSISVLAMCICLLTISSVSAASVENPATPLKYAQATITQDRPDTKFASPASPNFSYEDDPIKVRPQAGIGNLDGDKSYHSGLRLLFKASDDKKYGMELTRMFTDKADYIVAGVILERKQFGWLNLSIGSVGYFGQSRGSANVPGMLFNIGWEPETNSAFKPFVTIRYDDIIADKIILGTSVSTGLSIIF